MEAVTSELPYRVAFLVLLAVAFSISARHRRRADRDRGQASRTEDPWPIRAALTVTALPVAGLAVLFLVAPGVIDAARFDASALARWMGAALSGATLPGFVAVFSALGDNVTPTAETRDDHALVVEGPYRRVRHPLYSLAAVFWIGLSLLAASWAMAVGVAAVAVVLAIRTRREERALLDRFGESYARYRARTGRFVPGW